MDAHTLYCEYELLLGKIAELQQQSQQAPAKPTIAAWGLMNAGKSYLLNMLTEHIEEEYFKTNDFRETTEIKTFDSGKFIYLDTPGLDANSADNTEALKGVAKADVVLFTHQPQGELEQVELDFLRDLVQTFGRYAADNIVLVITKADKENAEKIIEIEQRILAQCQQYLGFPLKCFQVSGTRFHDGICKHKDGLTKASHIGDLAEHIQTVAQNSNIVAAERIRQTANKLHREASQLQKNIKTARRQSIAHLQEEFAPFVSAAQSLRSFVDQSQKQYSTNLLK